MAEEIFLTEELFATKVLLLTILGVLFVYTLSYMAQYKPEADSKPESVNRKWIARAIFVIGVIYFITFITACGSCSATALRLLVISFLAFGAASYCYFYRSSEFDPSARVGKILLGIGYGVIYGCIAYIRSPFDIYGWPALFLVASLFIRRRTTLSNPNVFAPRPKKVAPPTGKVYGAAPSGKVYGATTDSAPQTQVCKHCGRQIDAAAKVCPDCGAEQ